MALNPDSVLDVGAGFGKYGMLCREYLELWDGRQKYSDFRRRIDAVEAFEIYITPLHNFVYNHIYIGDIQEMYDELDFNYDLVLLIDVLEHFNKQEGERLINRLLIKNKGILISTPKMVSDQKDAFENEYETHRSQWKPSELSSFGSSFFIKDHKSVICYIGKRDYVKKLEYGLKKSKKKQFLNYLKKRLASIHFVYQTYHLIKGW